MRSLFAIISGLALAALVAAGCGAPPAASSAPAAVAQEDVSTMGTLRRYADSRELHSIPPVDPTSTYAVTGLEASWPAIFAANPGVLDFTIGDVNLEALGSLTMSNQPGGTAARPRTIRYVGANDHLPPWARAQQARVGRITVQGLLSSHWLLSGLTVRGKTQETSIGQGASDITLDRLWDVGSLNSFGVRVRLATDITLQRSLLDTPDASIMVLEQELIGFSVGNITGDVTGIKCLDTEARDWTDGIQTTDGPVPRDKVELLVDGFHAYITPARYLAGGLSSAENAIDLKAGSDIAGSTIIRNSVFAGFRRQGSATPSDLGVGVVIHKFARNVTIEDCVFLDMQRGVHETGWPAGEDLNASRFITLRRNQYYQVGDKTGGLDVGAVHRPVTNWSVANEVYIDCDVVLDVSPSGGYRAGSPTYTNCLRVRTDTQALGSALAPYAEASNAHVDWSGPLDRIQWKRATGPIVSTGVINVPTTYKLIRERQISVVKALTSSVLPDQPFRPWEGDGMPDLASWAEAAAGPFRVFDIAHPFDYEGEGEGADVPGTDMTKAMHTLELVVSYPRVLDFQGQRLEYVIDEDLHDLRVALGLRGYANYEALGTGLHRSQFLSSFMEERPTARVLHLRFALDYDRSI